MEKKHKSEVHLVATARRWLCFAQLMEHLCFKNGQIDISNQYFTIFKHLWN